MASYRVREMGAVLNFAKEVNKAMLELAHDPRTLFLGQSVAFDGAQIHKSLVGVPEDKRMEMPVIEDFQLGYCIGLSLIGYIPICIYPRLDFMMLCMNQLVNHLDRLEEMSDFRPKVIVRTTIGGTKPLNAGPQHTGNYTAQIRGMLRNVVVQELTRSQDVQPCYSAALHRSGSTLIVENP